MDALRLRERWNSLEFEGTRTIKFVLVLETTSEDRGGIMVGVPGGGTDGLLSHIYTVIQIVINWSFEWLNTKSKSKS